MGVFAKMCSVEAFQRAKSTRTGISVWISCLVAISKGCTVSPGFFSGVDSCNVCCSLRAGEDNDIILLGYGMVGCGFGVVWCWYGFWYGLLWSVMLCWSLWAGEDNARQPESFGGKFAPGCSRPFAPRCCGRCTALLYMQPCSLSRRHWWGWSHLWFSRLDFMLDANWRLMLLSYQYQSTFHQFYAFNFRYYSRDDFSHKYGWFFDIIQKLCRFLMLQVGPCPFDHDF